MGSEMCIRDRIYIPNRTILVHFGGISGEFGRAMVRILARRSTKKVRLGIYIKQSPVVRKPITLIQDYCQLFFHIFSFLVKASFAYSCLSKSTSHVKFCRILALNNTLELRNKLLG